MTFSVRSVIVRLAAIVLAGSGAAEAAPPAAPGAGTISIEPSSTDAEPPASAEIDAAVSGALADRGFTVLSAPGHSAYVAELSLSRTDVGTGSAKVNRQGGTVTPGGLGGVGGGVTLPLGGSRTRSVAIERVRLELSVRRRGASAELWHGIAVTIRTAGASRGDTSAIASDLAAALLRFYPNPPPGIVAVP